eukprot:CAMPEP_0114693718 /NCGR_PEP_ID=MMETSP0191-20121206/69368_1 /TAXON_ID=126664 /ORGANISM="Sorites sp." /LENGTH=105 /DNA_ID=CAMNT_0001987701 /DNA_START=203 /DNA_END=517 /DNA_ORIENTATION=+
MKQNNDNIDIDAGYNLLNDMKEHQRKLLQNLAQMGTAAAENGIKQDSAERKEEKAEDNPEEESRQGFQKDNQREKDAKQAELDSKSRRRMIDIKSKMTNVNGYID